MKETKSNWSIVTEMMSVQDIQLGKYASYWFHKTPRRIMHCLSYYKFAAKMIGKSQSVLDIGCNEGLGTYLLHKECGEAIGVDFDEEAIQTAKRNFPEVCFDVKDVLFESPERKQYNAVVNFDVIEHIYPQNVHQFWTAIKRNLDPHGMAIVGTPSLISQDFASEVSKKGHVNIYSHERLRQELERHFEFVFLFSANDEIVHTGYLPLAHYFIGVGCKKKD